MRDTVFPPRCSSSSPHVDHADQLSGQVAQSERVQPEGDHSEQHLWRKPHGKHLRAERGWGGSRRAPRRRRGRSTCSKALEEASRVVWPSTSCELIGPRPAPPAQHAGAAVAPRWRQAGRCPGGGRAAGGGHRGHSGQRAQRRTVPQREQRSGRVRLAAAVPAHPCLLRCQS